MRQLETYPAILRCVVTMLLLAVWTGPIQAIQPQLWVHTTESDFSKGELDRVVITNLGDLKLAAASETIGELDEKTSIIYDLQHVGNELFLAGGPEAVLLRRNGEQISEVLRLDGEQIFALEAYEQQLLVGISGATSRLALLKSDALETLIELPDVRYVWDIIVDGQDIYLATGTEGQLLHVDLSHPVAKSKSAGEESEPQDDDQPADQGETFPRITVLLDSAQANLLCLARNSAGQLYVGSDTDGLIYTVSVGEYTGAYVIYDAAEPEIGAILVTDEDVIYAGTADAKQARPGRLDGPAKADTGRPAPAQPPDQPADASTEKTPKNKQESQRKQPETPKTKDDSGDKTEPSDQAASGLIINPLSLASVDRVTAERLLFGALSPLATAQTEAANGTSAANNAPSDKPTPQQYDRLRKHVEQQLKAARDRGQIPMATSIPSSPRRTKMSAKPTRHPMRKSGKRKPGNAIYRISPDHFVTEIFRESVMILKMIEHQGKLIVATGNDGQIYSVDPQADETTVVVDLEASQVPAIIAHDDHYLLGTANPASLTELGRDYAAFGTYTSHVLDASQVSKWGMAHLSGQTGRGTSVSVELRASNVEDPDQAAWSNWSDYVSLSDATNHSAMIPYELPVGAPPGRFLQYRLTLYGNDQATPFVDKFQIAYVVPNQKPKIQVLNATYPGQTGSSAPAGKSRTSSSSKPDAREPKHESQLNITWKATDPNSDPLKFDLEYRPVGLDKWLPLVEDLTRAKHTWQTQRIPDGWYVIRVTASDEPGNPPEMARHAQRDSPPVLVDNTPPVMPRDPTIEHQGQSLVIKMAAQDQLSPIKAVHWTVDAADDWQPALPDDHIYDSTSEELEITIRNLDPGAHAITLRLVDARGNAHYRAQYVEIK